MTGVVELDPGWGRSPATVTEAVVTAASGSRRTGCPGLTAQGLESNLGVGVAGVQVGSGEDPSGDFRGARAQILAVLRRQSCVKDEFGVWAG